jgi:protein-L-isoaspartate(D-aspartate) O-methyltransferase
VSDQLAAMRERLAERVITANGIGSERIAAALHAVPRHLFLPELRPERAYTDDAIVTKRDEAGRPVSSSSQPAIMAIMLDQLDLAPGQRVLEIGAGTGYNAALIAHIVGPSGQVTSVDIDAELAERARVHLASAGYPDVTVACGDGAAGFAGHAPYDRIIATVGVSDLAPAWLGQAAPEARIVVPLDVRGTQLSVAFGRADAGHWASGSLAPCGFMRMRGALAGPERIMALAPGLWIMLPDGAVPGAGPDLGVAALAAALAGPPVPCQTGVGAGSAQVFWGLGLWLGARDPRSCRVDEEGPGGRAGPAGGASWLARAPLRSRDWRATLGILVPDGIAVLTAAGEPAGAPQDTPSELVTLGAAGFGAAASELAVALAGHVRDWAEAGRPGVAGLHVDAYPRSSPDLPAAPAGALVMERPGTRFVVYRK